MLCCSDGRKGEAEEAKAVPVTANGSSAAAAGKGGVDAAGPGPQGQLVEVKFRAPKAGKYDLTLFCVSGAHSTAFFADLRLRPRRWYWVRGMEHCRRDWHRRIKLS